MGALLWVIKMLLKVAKPFLKQAAFSALSETLSDYVIENYGYDVPDFPYATITYGD